MTFIPPPPPPIAIVAPIAAPMQTPISQAPFQQSTPIPFTNTPTLDIYLTNSGKGRNAGRFLNQRQKRLLARHRNHRK